VKILRIRRLSSPRKNTSSFTGQTVYCLRTLILVVRASASLLLGCLLV
jgi:hypothetical protein